jgi:FKBP-type peptidyl-prolyl cis-trans isomerase SlyD
MNPAGTFLVLTLLLVVPVSALAQTTPAAPPSPAAPASPPATAPSAAPATPPATAPGSPAAPTSSAAPGSPAAPSASAAAVEQGSTVKLEYTLKDDAGIVLDSNKGQDPLTFTQGADQLMPGLEKEIIGMHAGEEKKVVLKPEDAFGPADPAAQAEVPKGMLPPDALTVGARLMARNASGEQRPVTVKEIKEDTVILDLNHPLAGKTLVFELKVLGVEPPKAADPPKAAEPKSN